MYGWSDGCILILLSLGVALLLTLALLFAVMGDAPSGTHRTDPKGLLLACIGSWLFTICVVVAEAIHDQRRRPRR